MNEEYKQIAEALQKSYAEITKSLDRLAEVIEKIYEVPNE